VTHAGGSDKEPRVGDRLIAALLVAPSQAEAAKQVGISLATVQRWLRRPKFLARYRAARRKVVEGAIAMMQGGTEKAAQALIDSLDADRTADVIKAADLILNHAIKGADTVDLIERVEQLEEIVTILREQASKHQSDDDDEVADVHQ
jgi:hypothetical protein